MIDQSKKSLHYPKANSSTPITTQPLLDRSTNLSRPSTQNLDTPSAIPLPIPRVIATTAFPIPVPFSNMASTSPNVDMRDRSYKSPTPGTESDASSGSPKRCFCGVQAGHGGIYCSIDCARSDAFSSLCYKPGPSRHQSEPAPLTGYTGQAFPSNNTLAHAYGTGPSAIAMSASRSDGTPSLSAATTGFAPPSSYNTPRTSDWDASSHYRRVARADLRREERREERKRRRAQGSVASNASRCTTLSTASASGSSSSRVPDLIGGNGYSHSRNPSCASTASTVMSDYTSYSGSGSGFGGFGGLSRNPSTASNMSTSRRYRGDMVEVIQEDEDEDFAQSMAARPYPSIRNGHVRRPSASAGKKRVADPLGMGKDMRDILEEIISMEKSFSVDDDTDSPTLHSTLTTTTSTTASSSARSPDIVSPIPTSPSRPPNSAQGLFTAIFDRPPRTPSPAPVPDRARRAPDAPGAPVRGHRNSMSVGHLFAPDNASSGVYGAMGLQGGARLQRPPSFLSVDPSTNIGGDAGLGAASGAGAGRVRGGRGHQSSLSESHTALYLATASPEAPASAAAARADRPGSGTPARERGGMGPWEDASRRGPISPDASTVMGLRMKSRNSLTFSPEVAGPALPIPPSLSGSMGASDGSVLAANMGFASDSHRFAANMGANVNVTPSKRRPGPSPNANYGSMGGWRFPSSTNLAAQAAGMQVGANGLSTPTGSTVSHSVSFPFPSSTHSARSNGTATNDEIRTRSCSTPLGAAHQASRTLRGNRDSGMSFDSPYASNTSPTDSLMTSNTQSDRSDRMSDGRSAPHLLWPPPRHLEPSLFPTSPGVFGSGSSGHSGIQGGEQSRINSPPKSGLRLGVLLGSGNGAGSGSGLEGMTGMDVDMEGGEGLAYLRE